MSDRSRDRVGQYLKSWQPAQPSKTYFTDFAGGGVLYIGTSYKYHFFTSSGSWNAPVTNADVIVVAGGGGAGSLGGGGGAGGVRNLIAATFVVGTSYTVTIGAAGVSQTTPTAGGNSSIVTSTTTISATGGGRGGSATGAAGSGGCGGGGKESSGAGGTGNAGAFSPVEGFAGTSGSSTAIFSGGGCGAGGSAGGAGSNASNSGVPFGGGNTGTGGSAGVGIELSNDMTAVPYIFDSSSVQSQRSTYDSSAQNALVYVGIGGCGMGYAGSLVLSSSRGFSGAISSTYNTTVVGARGYGCGGGSGHVSFGDAKGGIVIVRYAL